MKLLELDIINQGINYPENHLLSLRTENSLEETERSTAEIEKELDYEDFKSCFQYCPTNFKKCLAYDIMSVMDLRLGAIDPLNQSQNLGDEK